MIPLTLTVISRANDVISNLFPTEMSLITIIACFSDRDTRYGSKCFHLNFLFLMPMVSASNLEDNDEVIDPYSISYAYDTLLNLLTFFSIIPFTSPKKIINIY